MKKNLFHAFMAIFVFLAAALCSALTSSDSLFEQKKPQRAFIIPAIAMAVGAIAGSTLGSAGKNKSINTKMEGISKMAGENEDWFNRRYNEDVTQRADAQRLLSMTEEAIKRRNRAAEGRQAVMGGTDESVAAEKEKNSQLAANVTSQIAAEGERRKDAIERQYLNRKNHLRDEYYDLGSQKDNGFDIAGKAINGAANAYQLASGLAAK